MAARQMEKDRAAVLPNPTADLAEAEAQGAELEVGHVELSQPAADGVEQPGGGAVQQEAKLGGPERVAAQAIGAAALLEILDAEFRAGRIYPNLAGLVALLVVGGTVSTVTGPARAGWNAIANNGHGSGARGDGGAGRPNDAPHVRCSVHGARPGDAAAGPPRREWTGDAAP
jgi:hypothetical protein